MQLTPSLALEEKLLGQIGELDLPGWGQKIFDAAKRTEQKVKDRFDEIASTPVDPERAYKAVLKLLRNESLTRRDYSLIAGTLNLPIREINNQKLIETGWMSIILQYFKDQYTLKSLSMLGWIQLLTAYFSIPPNSKQTAVSQNRERLRLFLKETHQYFFLKNRFEPRFSVTLRNHSNLLSDEPCQRYVANFFNANYSELAEVKDKLFIQPGSWFFQQLTVAVVKQATQANDAEFKSQIAKLIDYLNGKNDKLSTKISNTYRDEAIQIILMRYYQCTDRSLNKELCEYVISPNIWKSPNLRDANMLSKWSDIDRPIWQMVNGWVNRKNLRAFFEILSKRHDADKGRFNFWIKYVDQIEYTRFVFGGATNQSNSPDVKKLRDEEKGVSSILDGATKNLDAFIIQIRGHTFVEFSMNGNAAFLYRNGRLPFSTEAKRLTHAQLGRGNQSVESFHHRSDWPTRLERKLIEDFDIFPDRNHSTDNR